jgi:hypothetical protein
LLAILPAIDHSLDQLTNTVELYARGVTSAINANNLGFAQALTLVANTVLWTEITIVTHAPRIIAAFSKFSATPEHHNLHRKFLTVIIAIMTKKQTATLCKIAIEATL